MTIKHSISQLAVLLLALPLFGGEVVSAEATYTPSVAVVLYAPAEHASAIEQTVVPVVGAKYRLAKVNPSGQEDPTFAPVMLTTNQSGRVRIAGEAQLPRGHYRLTRVGTNKFAPIAFTLPYTEDGQVKDDMVIYPKSNLTLPDTGVDPGVIIPGGNNGGQSGQPGINQPDKILQTSGQIGQLPWWQLLLLGFGTLLVSYSLLLLKRKKEAEEEG